MIDEYDPKGGVHHVTYDDGDKRWYDMSKKVFRIIDEPQPARDSAREELPPAVCHVRARRLASHRQSWLLVPRVSWSS